MRCDVPVVCVVAMLMMGCSEASSVVEDAASPDAPTAEGGGPVDGGGADAGDAGDAGSSDAGPGIRLLRLRIVRDVLLAVPGAPVPDGRAMLVLADGTTREAEADAGGEVTFRVPEDEPFTVTGYVTEPEPKLAGFVGFMAAELLDAVEGSYLAGDDGVPLLRAGHRAESVAIAGTASGVVEGGLFRVALGRGLALGFPGPDPDWLVTVTEGVPATLVASYAEPDGTPTSPRGMALRTVGWDVVELPALEMRTEADFTIDPGFESMRGTGSIPVPGGSRFLDEAEIDARIVDVDTGLAYGFADRFDLASDGGSFEYEVEWIDIGASRSTTRFVLYSDAGVSTYWADGRALGEHLEVSFLDQARLVIPEGGWPISWADGLRLEDPPPAGALVRVGHSRFRAGSADVVYPPGTTELQPPPLPPGTSYEDFFGDGSSAAVGFCDDPIVVRCRRATRADGVEIVP